MISIVCSTREIKEGYKKHLLETCGLRGVELLVYENKGEFSLTSLYNKGLSESKFDTVVFLHDDLEIRTKNWGNKVLNHFKRNPEFGILGVAGTKNLPVSGKWWENPRKMYGNVYHTHEGKTWLSSYSKDLGNKVSEVVIVDGVFFSVCKSRLKETFDENIGGFHFYDVDFCFRNQIAGVKVGVHYDIKVNHFSIGVTNDEWENKRVAFSEKFGEKLPINILKEFDGENVNVLFAVKELTEGVISTIMAIAKDGCDVTVCSVFDEAGSRKYKSDKYRLVHANEPPSYKRGDGKWLIKTQAGEQPSVDKMLYRIAPVKHDIIVINDKEIGDYICNLYPEIPIVHLCSDISVLVSTSDKIIKYLVYDDFMKSMVVNAYELNQDKIATINGVSGLVVELKQSI